MLDQQENVLPDATENQSADNQAQNLQNQSIEPEQVTETPEVFSQNSIEIVDKSIEIQEVEELPSPPEVAEAVQVETVELTENVKTVTEESNVVSKAESEENLPNSDAQFAIDEVENQIAIADTQEDEVAELPLPDYSETMTTAQVVATMKQLLTEHPVQSVGKHIEALKKIFNVQFGNLLKEAKAKFLEEGGVTEDFQFNDPIQKEYNDVLLDYKKKRQQIQNELESQHQANLKQKLAIIEELKDLIENGNPDSMYKTFRDIQAKWRAVGAVPREKYSDTWRTYHFHVERFYDLLHLSNELREMDFKHNYEEKLKLVERVEALAENDDIKVAFDELQIIHKLWKEDIGPVSREHREEIWTRFSEATKKIHDRRHEYIDAVKVEFENNLVVKNQILDKLVAINEIEKKSHNEWQKYLKEVEVLRKKFLETGRVPRQSDKETWEKFRTVNHTFNEAKNQYYKAIKKDQQDNLDKKMILVEKAESLRESEDWETTTEILKNIQNEWKSIGHVPKQLSDKIWNRFKEACNFYFDRLHKVQDAQDDAQMNVYVQKKNLLEELKIQAESGKFNPTLEQLKDYIKQWKAIGMVPPKQRYIEAKFNKFLDPFFENLSSDKAQSMMIRYRNMIDSFIEQKDTAKINDEIQFVRKKLETVSKEKQQMETNRMYFSNADDNNPTIRKIMNNIEKLSLELDVWESKLQYLRSLDY